MNNSPITRDKINEIKNYYYRFGSASKAAKCAGVSKPTAIKYLKREGIVLRRLKKNDSDILLVLNLYNQHHNIKAVSDITGFKWETVAKYIDQSGTIRKNRRIYKYDENSFSRINNEKSAYWLGFLYADGCITDAKGYPGNVSFYLKPEDISHCYKFIDFIGGDIGLVNVRKDGYVGVSVSNKKMASDLVRLGVCPRKSLILTFPQKDIVPDNLVRHFLRGYFDGDGSLYVRSRNNTPGWAIVGTKEFLVGTKEILENSLGMNRNKLYSRGTNTYELKYEGNQAVTVSDYLYRDCEIYLDRKYKIYACIGENRWKAEMPTPR